MTPLARSEERHRASKWYTLRKYNKDLKHTFKLNFVFCTNQKTSKKVTDIPGLRNHSCTSIALQK